MCGKYAGITGPTIYVTKHGRVMFIKDARDVPIVYNLAMPIRRPSIKSRRCTVILPLHIYYQITALASKLHVGRSALAREAITIHLSKFEKMPTNSNNSNTS